MGLRRLLRDRRSAEGLGFTPGGFPLRLRRGDDPALSRRRAYEIVDRFEDALCEYTNADFAVTTDSCTNAILLSLLWWRGVRRDPPGFALTLPAHTYVGVAQAAQNAGYGVEYRDWKWENDYWVEPLPILDAAKHFGANMYPLGSFVCLSFGTSKRLPIGKGGAILLDDEKAAEWLRSARMDGRTAGENYAEPSFQAPGYRCNMTPEQAARGLDLLTYIDDEDTASWRDYPDLSKAEWR